MVNPPGTLRIDSQDGMMLILLHKDIRKQSKLANSLKRKAINSMLLTPQSWHVQSKHGITSLERWVHYGSLHIVHGDSMSVIMELSKVSIRLRLQRNMEKRRWHSGDEVLIFHHQSFLLMTKDIQDSRGDINNYQMMFFLKQSPSQQQSIEYFHTGMTASAHRFLLDSVLW